MSAVLCPSCLQKGMTWYRDDDDISHPTHWQCGICGFTADEDERNEKKCAACSLQGAVYLFGNRGNYWWCTACSHREVATR